MISVDNYPVRVTRSLRCVAEAVRSLRSFVAFVRCVRSFVRTVETDDALDAASAWMQRSLGPMKSDETTALVAARSMLSLRG